MFSLTCIISELIRFHFWMSKYQVSLHPPQMQLNSSNLQSKKFIPWAGKGEKRSVTCWTPAMCHLFAMFFKYVIVLVLGHIIVDKATFRWGQRAGGAGSRGAGSWGCQCVQVCSPHFFPPSTLTPRRERSWGRPQGSGPISSRSGGRGIARVAASSARCPWQGCAPSLVPKAAGVIQGNGQGRKAGCGAG